MVAFGYGLISGSKRDPTITREVLEDHNSSDDAGAWSNRLFPASTCGKVNAYTTLRKHLGQMRSWHYSNTYVLEDAVWRILPSKRVEIYKKVVEEDGKARAHELLDILITELPNLIDMARLGRGEAFKESDYPSPEDVRSTFKYSVSFRPIPTSAGLNPALFQSAIDELNQLHAQRLQEANVALVERFIQPFKNLQEQLADTKNRKLKPVFASVLEICQMIPTLDLSGNQDLVTAAQQMEQVFSALQPEMVKADEDVRKMLATTCANVVGQFGNIGKRAFA